MPVRPYPFQREDACQIERFQGRCLLASEMGLGKSVTSLLWAHRNPAVRPVVIVCPASLKWNWQRECSIHFGIRADVLEGMKPIVDRLVSGINFYIINYTILGPWLGFLKSLNPQLVIVDECHSVANRKTNQSKNTRLLCKNVPHVIAISGTPLTNRPAELWTVLNLLRPDLYPSFFSYAHKFTKPQLKPWGWVYDGAANLDILHNQLVKKLMIRRRKADVLDQLPAKQRTVIPLEIENKKEYKEAAQNLVAWLAKTSRTMAKRAARAEQLVKVGHLKRLAGELKLKAAINWVDDFLQASDEKIILFAVHKKVVHKLQEKYKGQCAIVTGEVIGRERQAAFDRFLKDPKVRIFIGNIRAAGVGWSAKGVNNVAFLELDWVPGLHTQCEDRCSGIGRGTKGVSLSIFYLIARSTIEEKLCHIIQKKQETLTATLDGGKGDDLSIFDQLVKELLPEREKHAG